MWNFIFIGLGQKVFRGNNEINTDDKGRIAMPSRYRDALLKVCSGHLIVTIDLQDKMPSNLPFSRVGKDRS